MYYFISFLYCVNIVLCLTEMGISCAFISRRTFIETMNSDEDVQFLEQFNTVDFHSDLLHIQTVNIWFY